MKTVSPKIPLDAASARRKNLNINLRDARRIISIRLIENIQRRLLLALAIAAAAMNTFWCVCPTFDRIGFEKALGFRRTPRMRSITSHSTPPPILRTAPPKCEIDGVRWASAVLNRVIIHFITIRFPWIDFSAKWICFVRHCVPYRSESLKRASIIAKIKIYLSIHLIARRACHFSSTKAFGLHFLFADLHFIRVNCANSVSSAPVRAAGKKLVLIEPLAGRSPARPLVRQN